MVSLVSSDKSLKSSKIIRSNNKREFKNSNFKIHISIELLNLSFSPTSNRLKSSLEEDFAIKKRQRPLTPGDNRESEIQTLNAFDFGSSKNFSLKT